MHACNILRKLILNKLKKKKEKILQSKYFFCVLVYRSYEKFDAKPEAEATDDETIFPGKFHKIQIESR